MYSKVLALIKSSKNINIETRNNWLVVKTGSQKEKRSSQSLNQKILNRRTKI